MKREYISWFFQGDMEEQRKERSSMESSMRENGFKVVWADVCIESCFVVFRRERA